MTKSDDAADALLDDSGDAITDSTSVDKFLTENSKLFWDNYLERLGVGTGTPESALHVVGDITVTGTVDGVDIGTDVAGAIAHITDTGASHSEVVANSAHRVSDGSAHSDVGLNTTHRSSDGTDHANVALNDGHRAGNGSDHADVATNTAHSGGNGADHANVALNDTHRGSDGTDHSYITQDMSTTASVTHGELTIDNIQLNNNTLSTTSGDLNVSPAGTGLGVGVASPDEKLDVNGNGKFRGTGAVQIPAGATGERPTGVAAMIRWNTSNGELEVYDGANWRGVLLSAPV